MRDLTVVGNGIWDHIFMCILQNTDDLQSLKLDALEAFDRMLAHCVNLRTLSMNFCRFVADDLLLSIASNAKHIERLDVCKCNVSTTGLAQVAQHCTDLRSVNFSMGSGYATTEECKLLFRKETTVAVNHNDTAYAAGGEFNADEDYSSGDEASDDGEEEGGDWDF
eukprot:gene8689-10283_t